MKTFTTYAEKKAKQFLNLLQGYTKGIRFTAILILLLMGVSNAWAATIFNCGIEVNETWYKGTGTINSGNWLGSKTAFNNKDFGVITSLMLGGQYDTWDNNQTDKCSWNASNGITITIKKGSTQKDQFKLSCYHSGKDGNNNVWKTTGTIGQCGDKNAYGRYTHNISQYAAGNDYTIAAKWFSPSGISTTGTAKFTIPGFTTTSTSQIFDNTTVNSNSSKTISFGTHYGDALATNNCVISGTNKTEFSVTSITESGVTVKFAPTSAGSKSATLTITDAHGKTCTITLSGTAILPTYTVTFGVHSSGNGTLTAKAGSTSISSDASIDEGTTVVFTASPSTGYQIEGWYSNSDCTTPIDNGTNKTYTVTITGGTNVYVKFVEIPVNSHNITYTAQGTGWTYGNSNPTTAEEGATVTFVVNPTAGYRVSVSSDGPAITGPNANNQYTFTMPTKDVQITVDAKPEQYTVTLNKQSGTGGSSSVIATYLAAMPTITPPTRTGYTFNGYFDATSGGTKYYNANGSSEKNWDKTSNNPTLYAQWTANQYTITYKDQGNVAFSGTHTSTPPTKHTYGTATTLKTATKIGYTFDGWFTTSACTGTAVTSLGATDYTSNITLYAKWTELPPTTIYIKSDGNYADFKWNYDSKAYNMTPVDCGGTYYTANIAGGVSEIKITGSNNFTTTTLTVPTDDDNILYDLTSTTHLYLKPNSNWTQSNARFAAYVWNNAGNAWLDMTDTDKDGIYECEIPATYTSVIFCRMNPKHSDNRWNNDQDTEDTKRLWNQTNDLEIPTDGKNQYTVASGAWSNGSGTWSAIYDNNRWTTFDAPQLDVTIHITGKGSIVLNGETYTSASPGTTSFTISKTINEKITVGDITPAERWAYNNDAKIEMCDEKITLADSHTITGPATITLSFEQVSCEVVFNLNLPKGIIIPSWSIANQTVAMDGTATEPTSVGEIGDYLFGGWYKNGSTFTDANKYDFSTPVTGDLILYARWIPYAQCIFFKNNLKWKDVYVYTFSNNVWYDSEDSNTKYGPGVCTKVNVLEFAKMTQIDNTDIYYYILTKQDGFNHIAFSDANMNNWNEFFGNNAVYRSDRSDQMPLFIPQTDQTASTTNSTKYYSSGIWMKYNSTESGYKWSSDKNGWSTDVNPFTASAKGGYTFTTTVSLSGNTKYLFKVNNIRGDWYSKVCTITQDECTNLWFQPESDPNKNAVIQPNVTGDYVFTLYLGDGKVELSLEYPLSVEDYRLSYYDAVTGLHPGHYIKKRNEDRRDTVSFFVHVENNPEIRLEHCTAIDPSTSTATWEILAQYNVLKTISAHPSTAMSPGRRNADGTIYIGDGCGIDSTGVYNFVLQQSNSQADLATDATHKYEGHYYIRTDAAEGGWDSFRQASNQITYSSFADSHSNFNHYYCKYIAAGSNVKFTIANDYSYCISDTLDNDPIIEKGQSSPGCLPINANVRFGWDSNTNEISRAYIKGAGQTSDRFLVLQGKDDNLKDANGNVIPKGTGNRTGLEANEEILVDQQNWIYQVDVTANKNTEVKLVADYNGTTQYFKGNAEEYTRLLSSEKDYKIRLVYDFKSNHLITAWMAAGDTIQGELVLGADMMVIRTNQEKADQLNFNPTSSSLGNVGIGYAVMKFTKAYLENLQEDNETPLPKNEEKTERERSLYWVSFPFDVKISDVFGFGEYAEHWIMQYYDGAERAEKGLFIDSGTYWKYIEDKNTTLQAGTGYVLALNLNEVEFLFGATEVSLYFPSTDSLRTISGELPTADTVPEHWCKIDREWTDDGKTYYHKYTDSHWNLIGVPGFADINFDLNVTKYHFMQDDASFYYKFNLADSKYTVEDSHSTEFQAMYAYMVQFAGTIDWTSSTVVGATPTEPKLAARRYSDDQPEKVVLRLELAQGEEQADRTFIQLEEEGATAEFDLSRDLTKIINKGANIYTLAGEYSIQTAGNALPMEEAVVPVGVDIATAGEYTFRMPDGTEGMVVELLDYEANTRTNLLFSDYTVTLQKGSNENRFALYIQPSKSGVSTPIENVDEGVNGGEVVMKYLIDGKLFIRTADGVLYDAQGRKL